MPQLNRAGRLRAGRAPKTALVLLASLGVLVLASMAVARTLALTVARNAKVTNVSGKTVHENIVVGARSRAVYTLTGDSKSHPKCIKANGCFVFWPPVKVKSAKAATKAAAIKGKLGTWRRNGFRQLTLNGHPLYFYAGDLSRNHATGEGINTFGGIWHVVKPGARTTSTGGAGSSTSSSGTTSSSTTPMNPGYPIY